LMKDGKELFRKGELDKSENAFNQVVAREPGNAQPYYWLGQIAIKRGDINKGLALIEQSASKDANNPLLWQALGDA